MADQSSKVGELVAEIAAASNEQSQGIDQVNKAVAEMDKVVQQNAANAEESASASEEMNAQAEQMKQSVNVLIAMVGGKGRENVRTPRSDSSKSGPLLDLKPVQGSKQIQTENHKRSSEKETN